MNGSKKRDLKKVLGFSFLILLLVNIPLISAYLLITYGNFTFNPGEKYTINIPFIGSSSSSTICGKAVLTNGTGVQGVKVSLSYEDNAITISENITKNDGSFCVNIPSINKSTDFKFYVEYDNATIALGSNDYVLNFENNKIYSRSDKYITLTGNIENKDARIEGGRLEIKLGQRIGGSWKYIYGDYEKLTVYIDSNEVYDLGEELNYTKDISSLENGEYKFLIKTSFNGKQYEGKSVYFNITD